MLSFGRIERDPDAKPMSPMDQQEELARIFVQVLDLDRRVERVVQRLAETEERLDRIERIVEAIARTRT